MAGRLEGKVALISGAARGQGGAEAELFAREGARVMLADVLDDEGERRAAQLSGQGLGAAYRHLDVANADDWMRVAEDVEAEFGLIDVLINNAGIVSFAGVGEAPDEEWDRSVAVNQTGVMLGMRTVIGSMRRNGAGSIVNTASIFGLAGVQGYFAYQASKGAVVQMTRAAAIDLAPDSIRVNCICPGLILTDMTKTEPPDAIAENIEMTPLGRGGEPGEIASGALYLASDEASFVTGVVLPIDGGYMAQ